MQQDELDNVDDGEYPMPLRTQPAPAADCIVKCVTLPKCEYLKIAPLEATYLEIPDLRALLESHLRQNFSTITESTTLSVPLTIKYSSTTTTTTTPSSEIHRFLITECKPETVCSCIDVDINLDVVPLEGGGVAEEAVRRKFFGGDRNTVVVGGGGVHDAADGITEVVLVEGGGGGSSSSSSSRGVLGSVNGVVEKGECRYFRVKTVKSGDRGGGGGTYRVEAVPLVSGSGSGGGGGGSSGTGISSGDCNVFVSLSMVERPGLMEHDHYNVDTGVSVVEFGIGSGGGDGGVDDDMFLFKKEEFANHWHCDSCSLVSTVAASVKHLEMEHGMRHACVCGQDLPLKSLAGHKKRECPDRLIICRYCRLRVRAGPKSMVAKDIYSGLGLCEHESVCGSRTIECIKMLKSPECAIP
ncbi:hypothetical protein BDR26DRAFT_112824 [Obelidium mucronatum]|nr:hypothetical protein BDR26DRAFT_112824 [Obelidium mucronatum]